MESNSMSDSLEKMLMDELIQGRDVAKQLQLMFFKDQQLSPTTFSNEAHARDLMIQKILACFDKSITILQSDSVNQLSQQIAVGIADSPTSLCGSPKSQDSDGDFKDPDQKDEQKKSRKFFPLERRKLPGCSSSGLEQPIEDGYNWRKYGQKDILGAKYPRAYYRCTLRKMQECLATKQVQRCDEDPTMFEVTYRGKHTCAQAAASSSNPNPHPHPHPHPNPNPKPNPNPSLDIKLEPIETLSYPHHPQQTSHEIILSFQIDQQKDIKPFNPNNNYPNNSPSFSFPSSSNPRVTAHPAPTTVLHNNNNNFTNHTNFSPNTYACSSSPMMTTFDPQGHASSSAANINSPMATTPEFPFDQGEFDPDFMFDNSQFFP